VFYPKLVLLPYLLFYEIFLDFAGFGRNYNHIQTDYSTRIMLNMTNNTSSREVIFDQSAQAISQNKWLTARNQPAILTIFEIYASLLIHH